MAHNPEASRESQTAVLRLIAAFKLFKAVLLLIIGLAAIHLMHRDVQEFALKVARHIRSDPDSKFLHALIAKVAGVSTKRLEVLGIGAFVYSTLYFIEGTGLLLARRWAEWMAVITTGGFIPLEIYEVFHHPHWVRIAVMIANIAIVVYLVKELYRKREKNLKSQN